MKNIIRLLLITIMLTVTTTIAFAEFVDVEVVGNGEVIEYDGERLYFLEKDETFYILPDKGYKLKSVETERIVIANEKYHLYKVISVEEDTKPTIKVEFEKDTDWEEGKDYNIKVTTSINGIENETELTGSELDLNTGESFIRGARVNGKLAVTKSSVVYSPDGEREVKMEPIEIYTDSVIDILAIPKIDTDTIFTFVSVMPNTSEMWERVDVRDGSAEKPGDTVGIMMPFWSSHIFIDGKQRNYRLEPPDGDNHQIDFKPGADSYILIDFGMGGASGSATVRVNVIDMGEGGGKIVPLKGDTMPRGETAVFRVIPEKGYKLGQIGVEKDDIQGALAVPENTKEFIIPSMGSDTVVMYEFDKKDPKDEYNITVSHNEGGKPDKGPIYQVPYGEDTSITFLPDEGYLIDKVFVDGKEIDPVTTLIIENIIDDYEVEVEFKKIEEIINPEPEDNNSGGGSGGRKEPNDYTEEVKIKEEKKKIPTEKEIKEEEKEEKDNPSMGAF